MPTLVASILDRLIVRFNHLSIGQRSEFVVPCDKEWLVEMGVIQPKNRS